MAFAVDDAVEHLGVAARDARNGAVESDVGGNLEVHTGVIALVGGTRGLGDKLAQIGLGGNDVGISFCA